MQLARPQRHGPILPDRLSQRAAAHMAAGATVAVNYVGRCWELAGMTAGPVLAQVLFSPFLGSIKH